MQGRYGGKDGCQAALTQDGVEGQQHKEEKKEGLEEFSHIFFRGR